MNTIDDCVAAPLLDRAHLSRQTFGDTAFEAEILQLFLLECRQQIANLSTTADEKSWKLAVHTLKGSARTIGAARFASVCERAELRPFPAGSGVRQPLIAVIDAEFTKLADMISIVLGEA